MTPVGLPAQIPRSTVSQLRPRRPRPDPRAEVGGDLKLRVRVDDGVVHDLRIE